MIQIQQNYQTYIETRSLETNFSMDYSNLKNFTGRPKYEGKSNK